MVAVQEAPVRKVQLRARNYVNLLAEFHAAQAKIRACSTAFNIVLINPTAGMGSEEQTRRITQAALDYDRAREAFFAIVAELNACIIREIIDTRPVVPDFHG